MWRRYLENEGYRTIYFNAWESDFIDELLIALVGEVGCLLPSKSKIAKRLTSSSVLLLKNGKRYLGFQVWDFEGEHYDFTLYFV